MEIVHGMGPGIGKPQLSLCLQGKEEFGLCLQGLLCCKSPGAVLGVIKFFEVVCDNKVGNQLNQ